MKKDLIEFMKNIKDISKSVQEYEDEDGNYLLVPVSNLFTAVDYIELDKTEYKKALFNQSITDLDYKKKFVNRVVDKSSVTHDKSDQGILIDKEIQVSQIYVVKNSLGYKTCFTNKSDALKLAKEINNKYFDRLGE